MSTVAWLVAPYLSAVWLSRSPRMAELVAAHTRLTLPVGWAAVLALVTALFGLWSPPLPLLVACAVLSGLAMLTSDGGGGGGDDELDEDDDGPPPVDWELFDEHRRRWDARVPVTR